MHGFLGPNGAGKTTTIRILVGLAQTDVAPPASWAGIRGATRLSCTGGSPMCPAAPLMEDVFREVIRELQDDGRTVLLSSHMLTEVKALCDRVTIIREGRTVETGTLAAAGVITQRLPAGSVALGLRFAAVGWVFAAVAAVVGPAHPDRGRRRGIAVAALGGAFLLRAAGDTAGSDDGAGWLSWASPLGWAHRLRPFADERW